MNKKLRTSNTRSNKVDMIAKIIILAVLIVGISVSTASPANKGEEIPEYVEPTVPVEIIIIPTETENQQSYPSKFGYLTVAVKYASGLSDTDGFWNLPDPYAVVYAQSSDCGIDNTYRHQTHYIPGTLNPNWDIMLKFGWGNWVSFNIQIWDSDVFWDDAMTGVHTISVSPGVNCSQVYYNSGTVTYDYYLQTALEVCNGVVCE